MTNFLNEINEPLNSQIIGYYHITYTITSVGYGDAFMPNLAEYNEDYTIMLGCMITGIFLFNIQQAKLSQFFSNLGDGDKSL